MNSSSTTSRTGQLSTDRLAALQPLMDAVLFLGEETEQGPLVIDGVWDISDAMSEGEIRRAVHTRLRKYAPKFRRFGIDVIPFHVQIFNVHRTAYEILKRGLPLEEIDCPGVVLVNVAQIAKDDGDGHRCDRLFVAVVQNRIILGYAAENSPVLDQIIPFVDALYVFNTPKDWDRNAHFRSRKILPWVLALILGLDKEALALLTPIPLESARETLKITKADQSKAWWPDAFGPDLLEHNVKTAIVQNDPMLADLEYGDRLVVQFGDDGEEHEVVYAESLQSAHCNGTPALCVASSGIHHPEQGELHYLDIMLFGPSSFEKFGRPLPGTPLRVRKATALA